MELPKTKRYATYKDTGVEWLGEIPEHWDICKTKYLWKEVISLSENGDENLLSVSQYTGVSQNNNDSRSSSLVGYKNVTENNLVINIMLAWLGGLGLSQLNGVVSPAYNVYELIRESYPSYFHYLYRTNLYLDEFARKSKGVVPSRWRMYTEDFGQVLTICPPLPEQKQIADYLDKKTGQIDIAINQKEQMIELLKERKQILINRAVTRGLNPDVPLKDSGIEWIGQIPEHWEVKRLKYIANVVLGKMLCNENKGDFYLKPYLKSKNIQWLSIDISSIDEMWFSQKEMNDYLLIAGDLIVSEGGEVGKTAIWNNEIEECYIQNSAHKITFDLNHDPMFFLYLFFTIGKLGFFDSIVNKVSIGHLIKDKLINIKLIYPSLSEQKEIVSYIEQNTEKIDKAIAQKQQEIEKLKEYKATLIDSAVTGKICLSD